MDIRINANLNRDALTSVYKCLYYKNEPVELLVPEEQFYKINLPFDIKNPYVPSWRVICDHYNDANKDEADDTTPGGLPEPEKESGFKVGDLVMIDSESSEYNDRYGKITEVDKETGEYIVEEATQEEVDEVLGMSTLSLSPNNEPEFFGAFEEDELLPLVPQDDQGGGYGDEGDDSSDESGESGDEEQDTEDVDGDGDDSLEEDESSIERKEEILDNLKNGGVDGEPSEQEVFDDDEELDWSDKYDDSGFDDESDGDSESDVNKEGESGS